MLTTQVCTLLSCTHRVWHASLVGEVSSPPDSRLPGDEVMERDVWLPLVHGYRPRNLLSLEDCSCGADQVISSHPLYLKAGP